MTGFIIQILKVKRGYPPKLLFADREEGAEIIVAREIESGTSRDQIFVYSLEDAKNQCSLPRYEFDLNILAQLALPMDEDE